MQDELAPMSHVRRALGYGDCPEFDRFWSALTPFGRTCVRRNVAAGYWIPAATIIVVADVRTSGDWRSVRLDEAREADRLRRRVS